MSEPKSNVRSDANDFPGMVSSAGSRASSPAAAALQINLHSSVPGQLVVRPGLRAVGFVDVLAADSDTDAEGVDLGVPPGGGGDEDRIGLPPGEDDDEELPEAPESPPTDDQRWIVLSTDVKWQNYLTYDTPADDVGELVGGIEDFFPSDPAINCQQVNNSLRPVLLADGALDFYLDGNNSRGMNGFEVEDLTGEFTMYFSFARTTTAADLVLVGSNFEASLVLHGATSEYRLTGPNGDNEYTGSIPDDVTLIRLRRDADDVIWMRWTGEEEVEIAEEPGAFNVFSFGYDFFWTTTELTAAWKSMLIYSADMAGTENDLLVRAWLLENDGSTL